MKNTILKFDTDELYLGDETSPKKVYNYFSKKIDIYNILTDDLGDVDISDYTSTYKMADDDKLERISYDLYGTTDYWDVLSSLNERNPLFEIPYNFDVIAEDSTNFVDKYFDTVYSQAPLEQVARIEALSEEFLTDEVSDNEYYRYITVIKPSKMSQFLLLLKENNYL